MIREVQESIDNSLCGCLLKFLEKINFVVQDDHQRKYSKNLLEDTMLAPIDAAQIKAAEKQFNDKLLSMYQEHQSITDYVTKANNQNTAFIDEIGQRNKNLLKL